MKCVELGERMAHVYPAPVRTVTAVVEAATAAAAYFETSTIWWRGHAKVEWRLVPWVHRGGPDYNREHNFILSFRQRAVGRTPRPPDYNDPYGWLFFAQHYRLPTRLLDWTELPLAAVFFAVSEERDSPGAIWAFQPGRFNAIHHDRAGTLVPTSPLPRELIRRAFDPDTPESDKIAAIVAHEMDLRMTVQQAAFTIHGADAPPMEQLPRADEFLMRFDIPADSKRVILGQLDLLGIRRSSLFPDPESLATDIRQMRFL
jgi:hypothetical protein